MMIQTRSPASSNLDPFSNRNVIPYFHKNNFKCRFNLLRLFLLLLSCTYYHHTVHSYIIFATRKDIRMLDESSLHTLHYQKPNETILANELHDATGIDFDFENKLLFWTDLGIETINGIRLNDREVFNVITTGIETPESVACDWITKKLYWVDSDINHIDVSNYDGSQRTVLVWKDLDQPRTIVLVPSEGFMFWSDWGEIPKIERASMDGNPVTRRTIVGKDISWPNGLVVDYESKKLYFADTKLGYIASCDFDGQNLKTIVSNVSQIFALTINANMLYWTQIPNNQYKNSIHYYDQNIRHIGTIYSSSDRDRPPLDLAVFDSNRQPKSHNPCDINNGGCSHLCLLSSANSSGYSCACPTGILLQPDRRTCLPGPQRFLLLARRPDIRKISLDTVDYTPVVIPINVKNAMRHVCTLDYDPVEEKVYWTDSEIHAIKRSKLDGSNYETIIYTELMHPDGFAIDWVARNMYWTDAAIKRIEVSRLDGSSRKVLINNDIDNPRAIVVHPFAGLMFWSDWGETAKIERAALDGSDRMVIVNTSLIWPNGLAIDFELSHIYWCDAKTKLIEMSRFDGSDRRTIVVNEHSHMYGLTLNDEWIYWTDWSQRTVARAHKMTGNTSQNSVLIEHLPDLMGLKSVSSVVPNGTNPCAENNGNCSHLCFNRPHQHYVCGCANGFDLNNDGRTCIKSETFLLILFKNETRKISLKSKQITSLAIGDMHSASAFDVDPLKNRVYWTNVKNKTIFCSYINGSKTELIAQPGLVIPQNLALDWISNNLYWIDDEYRRIEVSRSNGLYRRIIFYDRNRYPYSLAVSPIDRLLFWSDFSSNGKIIVSLLDGNKRKTIVDSVGKAISLTVDINQKQLYWISVDRNSIMSSFFNGSNFRSIILDSLKKPTSLAITDHSIYFLNRDSRTLQFINKTDYLSDNYQSNNVHVFERNELFEDAIQIINYDPSNSKGWNLCALQNGGCQHLCFMKAVQKKDKDSQDFHCGCATHYTIDDNDNKKCIPPETFMLFSQKNMITRFLLDFSRSGSGDFLDIILPIQNLKNVKSLAYDQLDHYIYLIDGKAIKRVKLDEQTLESVVGHSHNVHPIDLVIDPYARILFWTCNMTNSINVTRIIRGPINVGSVHHSPHDRPRLLTYHLMTNSLFWTNQVNPARIERISFPNMNKTTIIWDRLRDVTAIAVEQELKILIWFDSGTMKMEASNLDGHSRHELIHDDNIYPISMATYAKFLFWIEKDNRTVERMPLFLNQGKKKQTIFTKEHVLTDIIAIPPMPKTSSYLYCNKENGGCSHFCFLHHLSGSYSCDCPPNQMLANEEPQRKCVEQVKCKPDEFQCRMGQCIHGSLRCNRNVDCPDESDEMDCPVCPQNQLTCFNNYEISCLDKRLFCNGINDCAGNFDELCCGQDEFRCNSNNCLSINQLCDGKNDCIDGEDEEPMRCSSNATLGTATNVPKGHFSYSFIVLVALFALIIFMFSYYHCPQYNGGHDDKEIGGANDILMSERLTSIPMSGTARNNRNPHKPATNGFLKLNHGKIDCNTLTTTTTISTLQPDVHVNNNSNTNKMVNTNPSLISQQTSQPMESLIERNVTGASSTSSSANMASYQQHQAINPPPSPATERSQCSSLSSSLFVTRPRQRNKNGMFCGGSKNRKKGYKKKWNKSSNCCPPPTPCSTDVYEPCPIKYVFYDNTQTEMDEYDYKPPPPTPRNYFSEPSCPPSPVTERSYCNPYPPPPSPVQDYE